MAAVKEHNKTSLYRLKQLLAIVPDDATKPG